MVAVFSSPTVHQVSRRPLYRLKLERLPDYLRDTVDWIIGRSRRKVEKENKRVASASASQRPPQQPPPQELCVCDTFDEQMIDRLTALPPGIDSNEWLSTHTLALFDHVNALCGALSDLCTPMSCPSMSYPGTSKAQYVDERGKRHAYEAMKYIDCAMSFCEQTSKDESLFPTRYGSSFSADFLSHVRRVMRLLWHCCGHLYSKHWDALGTLDLRPQLSLVMLHLARLSKQHSLLDPKDQQLLNNTVQLIRPVFAAPQVGKTDTAPAAGQRWSRVPSSKSGSWGGHPTPAVLSCKPYAQTC